MTRQSLKSRIEGKIRRSNRNVFLRRDFISFSGYDQVGRALLALTKEGKLKRIGYGLYAKARISRITGKPMIAANGGFAQVAAESCDRLGVKWTRGKSFQSYQDGSTQIPVKAEIVVYGRFSRKIANEKNKLIVVKNGYRQS